jgi:hypothetical protein
MTLYRRVSVLVGAALVIFGIVLQLPAWSDTSSDSGSSAASSGWGGSSTGTPAFSQTETITRDDVNADGDDDVVDSRTFGVTVDRDTELRGNQQLNVSWSGAHPTGGIVGDESSSTAAAFEEYPVVLMECRGIDSATAPAGEKLDPTTCWTQTNSERYNADNGDAYPAWRLDRYESAANTTSDPGQPDPLDKSCSGNSVPAAARWVPFDAADGTVYEPGYLGFDGCTPLAPEAANVENTSAPGNTTYGVTGLDGTGASKFVVWTADENASLGCSDTVPCALVIIPIMGVSCVAPLSVGEAASDDSDCATEGVYKAGGTFNPSSSALSVTGDLWWTASNWRDRVTVPLGFAQSSSVCSVLNNSTPLLMYGSPPMSEATEQWSPTFCTDPTRFTFRHVQTGEPSVKNLLGLGLSTADDNSDDSPASSSDGPSPVASAAPVESDPPGDSSDNATASNGVEAVLESDAPPGGYEQATVQAPVAVTGFAISYIIDDSSGHEYTTLKLTPRLLAKLMTESYPDIPSVYNSYDALAANPQDITHDPEFLALNPGLSPDTVGRDAASTLYSLSSNADTMFALTSYINADPEARAWLNGAPDPWGMVVNPNYRGISLPVESWPLLDSFIASFGHEGNNDCIDDAPTPYLPLVASPTSALSTIAQALQFASPLSQTTCVLGGGDGTLGNKLTTAGRQTPGFRFMIGLTSLGDAEYYGLDTAALQSYQVAPDPTSKFTTDAGRVFIAPSAASLLAAATLSSPDPTSGTWPIPYTLMRQDPANSGAYPGTMFVYLAVPVAGLPAQDAAEYAQFIKFAATDGQTPGFGNGELPPGYTPMTANAGLGDQVQYSLDAAVAVKSQQGIVPSLPGDVETSASAPPPASPSASSEGSSAPPAVGAPTASDTPTRPVNNVPAEGSSVTGDAATPTPSAQISAPVAPPANSAISAGSSAAAVFSGRTVASSSGLAASVLPSVLAVGLGAIFLASGLRVGSRKRR